MIRTSLTSRSLRYGLRCALMCACAVVLCTACQKDDDEPQSADEPQPTHYDYQITDSAVYTFADLEKQVTDMAMGFVGDGDGGSVSSLLGLAFANVKFNMPLAANASARFVAYEYTYPSHDPLGKPVTLSSLMLVPSAPGNKVQYGVLSFHSTIFSNAECPTEMLPYFSVVVADNCVMVFPDGLGYGVSASTPHPYISLRNAGETCVDAYLAALAILRDRGVALSPDFYTWLAGYSQGGSVSMAEHRHIETQLPKADQKVINLKWSYCGGGVYSPVSAMQEYLKADSLAYLICFPMLLQGEFYAHPDIFEGITLADYFTAEFYNSGLIEATLSKQYAADELKEMYFEFLHSYNPHSLLNPEMWNPESKVYKVLFAAMSLDELTTGWQPKAKMVLYHNVADNMSPYCDAEIAYDAFASSGNVAPLRMSSINDPSNTDHIYTGLLYYVDIILYGNTQKLYNHYFN